MLFSFIIKVYFMYLHSAKIGLYSTLVLQNMETALIQEIRSLDNAEVAAVIRKVMIDLGVPKIGTAYAVKALDQMFQNYDKPRATYFAVEDQGSIIGCVDVDQLENYVGNICELKEMYFLEEARGRGNGSKMMNKCLNLAREYAFKGN